MLQNRCIGACDAEHLFGTARQPLDRLTTFFHSPDGDTRLADGRARCGRHRCLLHFRKSITRRRRKSVVNYW